MFFKKIYLFFLVLNILFTMYNTVPQLFGIKMKFYEQNLQLFVYKKNRSFIQKIELLRQVS